MNGKYRTTSVNRRTYRHRRRIRWSNIFLLVAMLVTSRFIVKFALEFKNKQEIPDNKQVVLSAQSLFILNPMNTPTGNIIAKYEKKRKIVPDSNHIGYADEYAYDTLLVRQYIRGEKEYTGEKLVFLTFDDGPNMTVSPKVLDVLKEQNVHATFFLVGASCGEKHADIIKREINEGHGIAIHSYTHDYKLLYPGRKANSDRVIAEYRMTNDRLKKVLGNDFNSHVFRYPGGHMSWKNMESADNVLAKEKVEWIDWNALCGDGEPKKRRPTSAEGMYQFSVNTVNQNKNKDIIVLLMHDAENKQLTLQALPNIINFFKAGGYKFGILK